MSRFAEVVLVILSGVCAIIASSLLVLPDIGVPIWLRIGLAAVCLLGAIWFSSIAYDSLQMGINDHTTDT